MASMSFSMPKSAVDQLKGFISLCKSRPEIIHNEELAFFRDYLLSMGATLPPKPEGGAAPDAGKKPDSKPAPEPAKEEPAEMEVEESDESDVELDMEGVIGDPNPNIDQEMGDPNKKELTEQEMETFDDKRSQAMQTFSEVEIVLCADSIDETKKFFSRVSGRKRSLFSLTPSKLTPILLLCSPKEVSTNLKEV